MSNPSLLPSTSLSVPTRRPAALLAALACAAVLAGCASARLIESDVNSFGNWPEPRRPGSFAFERLPSQQAQPDQQAQIEATAMPALEGAGFRQAATAAEADALVQVAARTLRTDRGYYGGDPFFSRGGGFYGSVYSGSRWRGGGVGLGYGLGPTYYVNEVSLLIRDGRTKQVLYETRALNDGVWGDAEVRAALFEAAMKDFPRAAISPRRVRVEIAR